MWLFTPWNDERDLKEYEARQNAWLKGLALVLFIPSRWFIRITLLSIVLAVAIPLIVMAIC